MTALTTGYAEEKEENVGEKNEDKESDEPDFCLMTDKPQEVLNAVPTLENTLGLAGADEKLCKRWTLRGNTKDSCRTKKWKKGRIIP